MKFQVILFFILVLLLQNSCRKIDLEKIDNLNNGTILIIGHGGAGFQTGRNPIPANTEVSIEKVIEVYNADGVEIDVQLSKDNIPVLFHNSYLESATTCNGCISDYNIRELENCKYRQDFSVNSLTNEKIVSLEKIFSKYAGSVYKPLIDIDLKYLYDCMPNETEYTNGLTKSIVSLIEKYQLETTVSIEAGEVETLLRVKALNPRIKLYLDIHDFEKGLNDAIKNDFFGIIIENKEITKEQIRKAHQHNKWVGLFMVKDRKSTYEAIKKSPDIIQTDNVKMLQEFLSQ